MFEIGMRVRKSNIDIKYHENDQTEIKNQYIDKKFAELTRNIHNKRDKLRLNNLDRFGKYDNDEIYSPFLIFSIAFK